MLQAAEYQALPQITFDQTDPDMDMDMGGLTSPLLDTDPLPRPSPFDSRLEESTDFSSPNRTAL